MLFQIIVLLIIPTVFFGQTNLTLEITNLNPKLNGQILVSIFNHPDGFPDNPKQAYQTFTIPHYQQSTLIYEIKHLPVGRYAVALVHDANHNNAFDTNFFGYPEEGVGVSNNRLTTFAKPNFQTASFELNSNKRVVVNVRYY